MAKSNNVTTNEIVVRCHDGAFRKAMTKEHDKFPDKYPEGADARIFMGETVVFGILSGGDKFLEFQSMPVTV
jgi:hypothetical protein